MAPVKVSIIGSGNWGMAISKVIGENVLENKAGFHPEVAMYVHEEMVNGQKLTTIINTTHENVKYLPGYKVPNNIVAYPEMKEVVEGADIVVFVLPHQFVMHTCAMMKPFIKKGAQCVSLIKGLDMSTGNLDLISNVIRRELNIEVAVLMGANIASEVADSQFCEATIGCAVKKMGETLKDLFNRPYFKVNVVEDEQTVELCGALKNVVAVGAGVVDGLKYGGNTKAAVIRLGLIEIIRFNNRFFTKAKTETFLESCGFADLVTTCYAGRNRRVSEAFVLAAGKKTMEEMENELLNGQKLQGPPTALEVNKFLVSKKLTNEFPLFTMIHHICTGEKSPTQFISCLEAHF